MNLGLKFHGRAALPSPAFVGFLAILLASLVTTLPAYASGCDRLNSLYGSGWHVTRDRPVFDERFDLDGDEVVTLELAAGSEPAEWWMTFLAGPVIEERVQPQERLTHRIDLAEIGPSILQVRMVQGGDATFTATCARADVGPTIVRQPSDNATTSGGSAVFRVGADNATAYRWQVDSGSGFRDLADGGVYSATATANLSINGATGGMNGYLFRAVVSGAGGATVTSNAARLSVSAPAPTIDFIFPSSGTVAGGEAVLIKGSSFTTATSVTFGGLPGTDLMVHGDRDLTVTVPPHSAGAVDVTVTTHAGTVTSPNGFTYVGPSSNNFLSGLAISHGTLSPGFDPQEMEYAVAVASDVEEISITPTVAHTSASMTINGAAAQSGVPTAPLGLGAATTTFALRVMAQDGSVRTYSIAVNRAAAAPSILSISGPAAAIYKAGDTLTFAVAFDQPVTVIGTPMLTLVSDAPGVSATYSGGTGSHTLTFSYTVQPGTNASRGIALSSLSANGGWIRGSGLDADLTLRGVPDLSAVRIDTEAPTVRSTAVIGTPAPDATEARFMVEFSEPVTGVSASDFALFEVGTVSGTIASVSGAGDRYTVQLSGISGIGQIRLDVRTGGTIVDGAGNAFAVPFSGGSRWTRSGSANAALVALHPSAGALSPDFSPGVTAYTISVANAVEGITLTPTAADASATITVKGSSVASGGQTAPIGLSVGRTAIPIIVIAGDGVTTQTYMVTVMRVAASNNADLSDLRTDIGSFDPPFASGTAAYTIAVTNDVDRLALTPTAADANATVRVNGATVASGTPSAPVSLAVGATSIVIVVAAQDGTTTRIYTVSVERSRPVPVAASRTIEVLAGTTATVELTEGASGGPFTDAAIVSVSDAQAGSLHLAQGQQLVFSASPLYGGSSKVAYTLTNAFGTSQPATITFTVVARPDPAKDPEVIGLLNAQASTARRLAQNQIRNFNNRLEQLHDEGERRRNSAKVNLGLTGRNPTGRTSFAEEPQTAEPAFDAMRLIAGEPQEVKPAAGEASDAGNSSRFAIWTGGYVHLAQSDQGGIDLYSTMAGVSGGVDYRFSPSFAAGLGLGYGRDKSSVGDQGTESRANAWSLAGYASYKPTPAFFVDSLLGFGVMSFESRRFVGADGGMATGVRDGRQIFASVAAGYEHRAEGWLVSPYGRLEASRSLLEGLTEVGGGVHGLTYGNQHIDTLSAAVGLRLEYTIATDWGLLKPRGRLEYSHDFEGSSRVSLGYVDIGAFPYGLDFNTVARDQVAIGLGVDAQIGEWWNLGLDYRTAIDSVGSSRDHTFGARIGASF